MSASEFIPGEMPLEVARLVQTLRKTEERLQELMVDQVDSVLLDAGKSYLLSKAQDGLRRSEDHQRQLATTQLAILNALPAHVALLDRQGVVVSVNEAWRVFAGVNGLLAAGCGIGQNYLFSCDQAAGECSEGASRAAAGIRSVLEGTTREFSMEYPCHSPSEQRWFQLMVNSLTTSGDGGAVVMHINVTERKLAEERLARLNRLYQMLSRTNEAIVRVTCPSELFEAVCRIAVEQGAFGAAMVAQVDPETGKARALAHFGEIADYFREVLVSPTDPESESGTIAAALRTGRHDVCNDYIHDPRTGAWKEAALKRGYHSAGSFPVRADNQIFGVIVFFAAEPRFFQDDVVELLVAVVEDVSFALQAQSVERRRAQTDDALRASEATMAVAQRISHFGSWELDLSEPEDIDSNALLWSDEMFRIAGFEPGAVKVSNELFFSVVPKKEHESIRLAVGVAVNEGLPYSVVHRLIRPNGEERVVQETGQTVVNPETGRPLRMVGTAHDITEERKVREQLLWRTALFEAQVQSSPDGILVVDRDWKKVIQNRRMVELWNIPQDLADNVDDKPQFEWVATQVKNPAQFFDKSFHLHDHPDEVSRDEIELINGKVFDRYSGPVMGKDGRHYGRIWTFRDVTEWKRSERALRQSEAQFRSMFTSAGAGIAVSTPQGRFLKANAAYCSMVGYTEAELKERDFASLTHPEDLAINLTLRDEMLAGVRDSFAMEKRYIKKDGTIVWTRHSVSASRSEAGEILMMIVVAEDYTERRRIEGRFRRLFESNAQGMFFWNTKGGIIDANDAFLRMIHYGPEDVKDGRLDWAGLTPAEYAAADQRAMEECMSKGTCSMYEKEFVCKDGSRVSIIIGAALFEDTKEEGVAFVLDLTDRKKMEQQFLRAQRMESIGTLAGGIAHDLNNVLSPILMSIELLKDMAQDELGLKLLETLKGSAQRGADLVKQVLSFARGVECERLVVNPIHVMRDLMKVMRDTFPKSIEARFTPERNLWTVTGDPTQLHQVFLNLCVNARDAMPKGGNINIGMENIVLDETYAAMNPGAAPGSYVMVKVEDNGGGIPPAIRERIFEPFFTTKEMGKGTGLGLSTTLAIVKSHGGFINLYSEVGQGTKFKIYLPANPSQSASDDAAVEQSRLPRGNGEMILVVDDEEAIRKVAKGTLERFGYRVLLAANGAEGVALYAQQRQGISVVLTDMAMPIMDGPSMIIALKAMNPEIRIIGSSGLASNGGVAKAVGAGVQFFVPKPYTAESILTTLQKLLHGESEAKAE